MAQGPIKIDGLLDDPAWQDAPFSDDFLHFRLTVPEMPRKFGTHMKLLHDANNLYVAFDCVDSDIWSTFTNHDDPVMFEEAVLLHLDPLGNGRDYYGIYVNPLNAVLDVKRPGGAAEMSRRRWLECIQWNGAGIEHAVHVDGTVNKRGDVDNGWTVEIRVPFDTLGVRPKPGDCWLMQAGRMKKPRMSGTVISTWTDTRNLYLPRDFGTLLFK